MKKEPKHDLAIHYSLFLVRYLILAFVGVAAAAITTQSDGAGPELAMLRAGDVKPLGWIRKQMDLDLREGLAGNYPKVSNIVNVEIFAHKNGTLSSPYEYPKGRVARSWWVGEVEGNWLDSVTRLAFLTDNAQFKQRVRKAYEHVVAAQKNEPEGYIGIYVPADRFALRTQTKYNNGELWTQSRLFQGMLAYYEYSNDAKILDAVKKAVDCTLKNYMGREVFFQGSGVAHGIAFADTLEWLSRITGDPKYAAAMEWLYDDFCGKPGERPPKAGQDLSCAELQDPDTLWWSHTPHTMEGMHVPIIAQRLTGNEKYRLAAGNILIKYDRHDTPGGGVVGDEAIGRRLGSSMLPREYCTMVSAVMALNRIAVWTGDLGATRRSETIALNSAQGARLHPAMKAVRYLSHDNQKDASVPSHAQRYLYSSWHSAAPCCSTTAGRMMPYYVEGMWFADHKRNQLIANYYGPNRVDTTVAGRRVSLLEQTAFPFSDKVTFVFDADARTTLILCKPAYCGNVKVDARRAKVEMERDKILLRGAWRKGDVVSVDLDFTPRLVSEPNLQNASYYRWGALLFSLPLGEVSRSVKEYEALDGHPSGFFMWEIKPTHPELWDYRFDPNETFQKVDLPGGNCDTPYANPPIGLKGKMVDSSGKKIEVTLTPLGCSRLRRTSFPDRWKPIVDPREEWIIREKIANPDGTIRDTGSRKSPVPAKAGGS